MRNRVIKKFILFILLIFSIIYFRGIVCVDPFSASNVTFLPTDTLYIAVVVHQVGDFEKWDQEHIDAWLARLTDNFRGNNPFFDYYVDAIHNVDIEELYRTRRGGINITFDTANYTPRANQTTPDLPSIRVWHLVESQ